MILNTLTLTQFRNYSSQTIHFGEKFNALVGQNGMGKTNILDAIHYCCMGKSYFTPSDKLVVQFDQDFFRLESQIIDGVNEEKIVIKCPTTTKKVIEVSGKARLKLSDHVGRFLCVVVSPSDIHLLLETSEERRNFINNTISQTSRPYLEDLIYYNQLLKRRNSVLKSFQEEKKFDPLLLQSISQSMIDPAHRIYEQRMLIARRMNEIFKDLYRQISGDAEQCEIHYQSGLTGRNLQQLFDESVAKDRILGRTTEGVHKDDFSFIMNGEILKNFASQGQLKSYVLSLKLTQYHILYQITGKRPLLLLDDLYDKLDDQRVSHLLGILNEAPFGQVFISDTSHERIERVLSTISADYRIFTVENGTIES